ncbi:unnamed protein product, partial [Mycena citricolor]
MCHSVEQPDLIMKGLPSVLGKCQNPFEADQVRHLLIHSASMNSGVDGDDFLDSRDADE